MFKNMENLKIIAIHKSAIKKRLAEGICREFNSFILRLSGVVHYSFENMSFDLHPGDLIFIPKGTKYSYQTQTEDPCKYISLRFEAELENPIPAKYSLDGFHLSDEYVNNLPELWKFGSNAEHYKCYSVFYELLAYIENLEKLTSVDKKKSGTISPAISYMKKHIYDSDLKIETLIKLCGISGVYFNKIFHRLYGTTPQKYISSKRLSHAKTVIDSGDFDTISEVAAAAGFSDPLYFSRAFRKKYGISPSEYSKLQ